MAPIQLNFLYDKGSATTVAKVHALEAVLLRLRPQLPNFGKARHLDLREPLYHADVNIHFSIPLFVGVGWGFANVLLKDVENWSEDWNGYVPSFDAIMPYTALNDDATLVEGLKEVFALAVSKKPKGVVHCPPILTVEDCPSITIVTPTYNRRKLIDIAFHNLMATDYPKEKIEWIVVEDNENSTEMASELIMSFQVNNPKITVKYIPIQGRMSIGMKRNLGI